MKLSVQALLLVGLLSGVGHVEVVQAGVTRVAILLTGEECAVQRQALAGRLHKVQGIVQVDGRSVPDHLLIDVESGTTTAEQLVEELNDALASTSCTAEEMKSCITADIAVHQPMSR
jgi:hypothetical protein